jgi:uncharacterized membrane protein YdjX (TVP38/TMEM64 family)
VKQTLTTIAILVFMSALVVSYTSDGIISFLVRPGIASEDRIVLVQTYFKDWGALAPVAYVAMVTIEVIVAPIPGLMLYAPGGVIFGGFWGGLLSLVGNVLGAGISCQLIRIFGQKQLERLLAGGTFARYEQRLSRAGLWIILALRINPLTSSDLVSYAAGLTRIATWKVMLGTCLGMAPLCWTQAYLSDELLRAFPSLIYPLIALCVIYAIVAVIVFRRTFSTARS